MNQVDPSQGGPGEEENVDPSQGDPGEAVNVVDPSQGGPGGKNVDPPRSAEWVVAKKAKSKSQKRLPLSRLRRW